MSGVLLYNHGGCENRGCEAIVRSTAALFAAHAGMETTLASGQPEFDRGVGIPHVKSVISATISPKSVRRIINSIGYRLGLPREQEVARKYHPTIKAGKASDVCLSIGGDTYCYGRQEHLMVINGRLRRAGKPIVLWGCSINPELIAGERLEDLRQYDLIVARETITEKALADAGLPVCRWCDPAFTMKPEATQLPDGWRAGATVGLNISPLILDNAKDKDAALDAFCELVEHILKTSGDAVALLPHVTWAHDNDVDALKRVKARFENEARVFMVKPDMNAAQYKHIVSSMKALVTARTHASVAAYSTAVPTLVIGYSVKARGIARDIFGDENEHLIPVQELSGAQELISAYDALIARAESERAFLQKRMPEYTAGADEIVRRISALAKR